MEIYSSDLKLPGGTKFNDDWNYVAELFQKWKDEETDKNWKAYFNAKCALEQGLPVR